MERKVRVRFAPSPTGPLHIGGVRTALYNYLFARQHGGTMILRIEDTDSNRFVPGTEAYINEALHWLGIGIDEGVAEGGEYGPYKQSERRDIYRKYVKQLLDDGKAYIAFDTPEELDAKRGEIKNFQYDASTRMSMRNSLSLPAEEVQKLIDAGTNYVVRFKIEPGRNVVVHDLIRGDVTINSSILDDKVLLPLLLKPDGKGKLSKRDGDRLGFPVFPLEWHDPKSGEISSGYRESGYLPQAVVNFLSLLGWNPGDDREIMSMDELIRDFSFAHCSKSGAKFDFEKAKWFNHEYLMATDDAALAELFKPVLAEHVDVAQFTDEYIAEAVGTVKNRINFVKDLWTNAAFYFQAPVEYAPKDVKKRWKEDTPKLMGELITVLEGIADFSDAAATEATVMAWIKGNEYHMGNVMNAFRLTVVGECKGPHMFEITRLLGKEETIARIKRGVEAIHLPNE